MFISRLITRSHRDHGGMANIRDFKRIPDRGRLAHPLSGGHVNGLLLLLFVCEASRSRDRLLESDFVSDKRHRLAFSQVVVLVSNFLRCREHALMPSHWKMDSG